MALLLGVWLAEVGKPASEGHSGTGTLAVRLYSWALVFVFISAGTCLLWAVPNLGELLSGRQLNSQELEVIGNAETPIVVLGITLILSALMIGAAWKFGGSRAALLGIGGAHVAIYVVVLALLMPTFAPVKTYQPQSRWISAQIGAEPRFGMVDASGVGRRGTKGQASIDYARTHGINVKSLYPTSQSKG